jgi:4-hydroxybenzoate polyprenyltransferase
VLAQIASGDAATAIRAWLAMLGLQGSIGALNDLVDAPRDATTKPGKPIPRGAATTAEARAIAGGGLLLAVVLLVPSGPLALGVLAACAACGYAYDLWLSRTVVSWLPLTLALPLVPVFAWSSATGSVPAPVLALVPPGMLAGAGLALANGLADVERDRSTGAATAVVRLGRARAWAVQAALVALAAAIPLLVLTPAGLGGPGWLLQARPSSLVALAGTVAVAVGLALGRSGGAARRERAWELEALGVALVAGGWLAGAYGA